MKLIDVIRNAGSVEIDDAFAKKVESVYSCSLPELVKHILSIPVNTENFDEQVILRKLSGDMILDASAEMKSDFKGNHLLPLFDVGDNDYICYDYAQDIWCMYNIADDSIFNKHEDFLALL